MRNFIKGFLSFSLVCSAIASVASAAETVTYRYDAKGRLVKVTHSGTVNNGRVDTICHDDANNRTKLKSSSTGQQASCTSASANT